MIEDTAIQVNTWLLERVHEYSQGRPLDEYYKHKLDLGCMLEPDDIAIAKFLTDFDPYDHRPVCELAAGLGQLSLLLSVLGWRTEAVDLTGDRHAQALSLKIALVDSPWPKAADRFVPRHGVFTYVYEPARCKKPPILVATNAIGFPDINTLDSLAEVLRDVEVAVLDVRRFGKWAPTEAEARPTVEAIQSLGYTGQSVQHGSLGLTAFTADH